ncbi:MAG: Fic family protein [Actinomycetota bacterium]|nr:Fic family protein [Actinomycetota bacterium]
MATLGALAQNLLRSESVASSRIESIHLSHRRLARAAYQAETGQRDQRAVEVLGNVEAMKRAIELGATDDPFTLADLQDIHRNLLRFTAGPEIAGMPGRARTGLAAMTTTRWGRATPLPHRSSCSRCWRTSARSSTATMSPRSHWPLSSTLSLRPSIPSPTATGRAGRALIYAVLRRRGETTNYLPPISLILAAEPGGYIDGLTAYRQGALSGWVENFALATARACFAAEQLADAIAQRQAEWLDALGQPRRDAAVRQLVSSLPEQPVIDVAVAQRLTRESHVAVGRALRQLEDAGIVNRLNERKWGRAWECDTLLSLVDSFEKDVQIIASV